MAAEMGNLGHHCGGGGGTSAGSSRSSGASSSDVQRGAAMCKEQSQEAIISSGRRAAGDGQLAGRRRIQKPLMFSFPAPVGPKRYSSTYHLKALKRQWERH